MNQNNQKFAEKFPANFLCFFKKGIDKIVIIVYNVYMIYIQF